MLAHEIAIDKPSVEDRHDILKGLTQQFKMVAQQVEDDEEDDKTVEGETRLGKILLPRVYGIWDFLGFSVIS